MKTFSKINLSDPTGPGSPAWHCADLAASHFANGNKYAFFCAQRRMILELRANGASVATINAWKSDIRKNAVE